MALTLNLSKPRLIFDAPPLIGRFTIPFLINTVSRMPSVASEGGYMRSQHDASAFHHVLVRPSSWPLFDLLFKSVDYCWTFIPCGFSFEPVVLSHPS